MCTARFSRARFEKAFNGGMFDIREGEKVVGEATWWWVGQDGRFWVERHFARTYQRLAAPVAIVDERF